jgi:hypothetical protein
MRNDSAIRIVRSLRVLALVWLPAAILGAVPAAQAGPPCDQQAYFKPVKLGDLEFAQYTSTPILVGANFEQKNCAVLVNSSTTLVQAGVSATFRFASLQGDYTIGALTTEMIAGGDAVSCSLAAAGPSPDVVGVIQPTSQQLIPGAITNACCFSHIAHPPTDDCVSLPGEGDTTTVEVTSFGNTFTFEGVVLLSAR